MGERYSADGSAGQLTERDMSPALPAAKDILGDEAAQTAFANGGEAGYLAYIQTQMPQAWVSQPVRRALRAANANIYRDYEESQPGAVAAAQLAPRAGRIWLAPVVTEHPLASKVAYIGTDEPPQTPGRRDKRKRRDGDDAEGEMVVDPIVPPNPVPPADEATLPTGVPTPDRPPQVLLGPPGGSGAPPRPFVVTPAPAAPSNGASRPPGQGRGPGQPDQLLPGWIPEMGEGFRTAAASYAGVLVERRVGIAGAVARSQRRADRIFSWRMHRKGRVLLNRSQAARAAFEQALHNEVSVAPPNRQQDVMRARLNQLESMVHERWLNQWHHAERRSGQPVHWWQSRRYLGYTAVLGVCTGAVMGLVATATNSPVADGLFFVGAPAAGYSIGAWESNRVNLSRDGASAVHAGLHSLDDAESITQQLEDENRERSRQAKVVGVIATLGSFIAVDSIHHLVQLFATIGAPSPGKVVSPTPTPLPHHTPTPAHTPVPAHTPTPAPIPTQPPVVPPPPVPPQAANVYPWTSANDLLQSHGNRSLSALELVKRAADAYNAQTGSHLALWSHPNGTQWLQWGQNHYMSWADTAKFNQFMTDNFARLAG